MVSKSNKMTSFTEAILLMLSAASGEKFTPNN
jgi:hypothetical protein